MGQYGGVVLAVLVLGLILWFCGGPAGEKYCRACGATGRPRLGKKGSMSLELALWFLGFVLLPFGGVGALILIGALIYSMTRAFRPVIETCPVCGYERMIPLDSPLARSAVRIAARPTPPPAAERKVPASHRGEAETLL